MLPNRIVPRHKGQWSACNAANTTEVRVAELCPTLCDPMDYRIHGILQARILEWVAVPFSRGSSQPRDQTQISSIAGRSKKIQPSKMWNSYRTTAVIHLSAGYVWFTSPPNHSCRWMESPVCVIIQSSRNID